MGSGVSMVDSFLQFGIIQLQKEEYSKIKALQEIAKTLNGYNYVIISGGNGVGFCPVHDPICYMCICFPYHSVISLFHHVFVDYVQHGVMESREEYGGLDVLVKEHAVVQFLQNVDY